MQSQARIDQVLREKCDAGEIPGVVAMAANGNEVIYQGAFGKRDLSAAPQVLEGFDASTWGAAACMAPAAWPGPASPTPISGSIRRAASPA